MMTAYEKESVQITFYTTALSVLISFALLPIFGMTGAALVIALRLTLANYLKYRVVRKQLHLEPTILSVRHLLHPNKIA
jgi:hypothetical protein